MQKRQWAKKKKSLSSMQGRVREKLGSHHFSRIILLYSSRVMMRKSPVSDRKVASFNIPYHDTQWLIISLTFIYILQNDLVYSCNLPIVVFFLQIPPIYRKFLVLKIVKLKGFHYNGKSCSKPQCFW